jgi:hypothetical protein
LDALDGDQDIDPGEVAQLIHDNPAEALAHGRRAFALGTALLIQIAASGYYRS